MNKYLKIILTIAIMSAVVFTGACLIEPETGNKLETGNPAFGKVTGYRSDKSQPAVKDSTAPDFQFQMPDGKTMLLSDLRGKVVLLNFWQVNCPWCVKEMPFMQQIYQEWSDRGLEILAINVREPETMVKSFVTGRNLTFPIILDPEVYPSTLYAIRYLPTSYIIDRAGKIRNIKIGAFMKAEEIANEVKAVIEQ
jgi:peroxiredoxin